MAWLTSTFLNRAWLAISLSIVVKLYVSVGGRTEQCGKPELYLRGKLSEGKKEKTIKTDKTMKWKEKIKSLFIYA